MNNLQNRVDKIFLRINELPALFQQQGIETHSNGSDVIGAVSTRVQLWMRQAGLETRTDNAGNIRGRWLSQTPNAKTFIIASPINTVHRQGELDSLSGIAIGLDIVENIIETKADLPFNIEIIALCNEVNVAIDKQDSNEVQLEKDTEKDNLIGYIKLHIEHGPVLKEAGVPVAVATSIAGKKLVELIFTGEVGDASMVPIKMRKDALCAAAECIAAIEDFTLDHHNTILATVGKLAIKDSASDIIAGHVTCTLDLRSADNVRLTFACNALKNILTEICQDRKIGFEWNTLQETEPASCDENLTNLLKQSIKNANIEVLELVGGARSNALSLSADCPVSMLFIRSDVGVGVEKKDITVAIEVLDNFFLQIPS